MLIRLCLAALLCVTAFSAEPVFINEFMASNSTTLTDENGEFVDWVELRNTSAAPVNLGGYYLTDTVANLKRWTLPSTNIPANGYIIVYLSGKNRTAPRMHTDFSLDVDGEYFAFVKPDGVTKISEFTPRFPQQYKDFSYGLDATGTNWVYFSRGTAGAANSGGVFAFVKDTKFSQNRGFYDAPIDVSILTETAGATIRYTTNGLPPTATTGFLYTAPIRISGTTVLRAAAYKTGFQPSNVDTQTYLFLNDVIKQSPTGAAPPGWPASWGANTVSYGMDPQIVTNTLYRDTIVNDLKTLPSFSIVMNLTDLFDSTTGIYANPGQDGRAWERPCSVEFIRTDGVEGFQVDAGIRIRGGFSRATSNPKHAFRLFFREEYGDTKLRYPLFGDNGTDEFNNLDLRTFQNYSWSFQGDGSGVFIRDVFSRDTQLAMGHNAERGDYCHLYINGQYWGIFNTCERPEASYGETYFGGDKENFDVIKVEAGPYTINATDGNMDAWTRLYNAAVAGFTSNDAFFRVQGRNPDGSINPTYTNLVDVVNLIDYMLIIIYGGNLDAPISNFLGNDRPNNWYGMRNRDNLHGGFRFFAHDSEHTLLPWDAGQDRTGPFVAGQNGLVYSNPQYIFQQMWVNAEFRLLAADRIHRYYFNNGALTSAQGLARFRARMAQLDRAVVGESARWGDSKREPAFTRQDWVNACNNVINNWLPGRTATTLQQLRNKNLYPATVAPTYNQHGGNVQPGFLLTMTAPAGLMYYTLDGSDPRLVGGALSAAAKRYAAAVPLSESAVAKARVLNGTSWSALNEATFTIIRTNRDLLVTELMYHPVASTNVDANDLEFIELKNTSTSELDLSGIRFTNGITYAFPLGKKLGAGKFVVLVRKPDLFALRYPGVQFDGVYTNKLDDAGERIDLVHAAGAPIASVTYDDISPWAISADGAGFSLVPRNPNSNPDPNNPFNWRASSRTGGSPGQDDPPLNVPIVVISEALTHTDLPTVDAVEIYNPTESEVDIGGWFLTDDRLNPKKYKFPSPTLITSGDYLVVEEPAFNPTPGVGTSFSLSSHGDEVFLYSADASENLTGYSDGFSFGAAENPVSFGRYTNSVGEVLFPPQIQNSLDNVNAGPRIGPVVINEIRYAPKAGDEEFIELRNLTASAIKLYDVDRPTNRWRINGVDFTFPANAEISANGYIVIASVDPSLFRAHNTIPAAVQVFGPYFGTLQDSGESLELQRPDAPDPNGDGTFFIPYITVDEVRYNDKAPWPVEAAGSGPSLERIASNVFGNDPVNWRASFGVASPGLDNNGNRPPKMNAGFDGSMTAAVFPVNVNLGPVVTDDGLPTPTLTYSWSQVSGPGVVVFQDPTVAATTAGLPGVGVYVLRLSVSDGEFTVADEVQFQVDRPLSSQTFVPTGSRWRYLDDGSNQGTAWRATNFVDTAWKEGPAILGYGDPSATTIASGPSTNRFITSYFRRTFNVSSVAGLRDLTVSVMRDDGAVVYLNGQEVFRSNMAEGIAIGHLTPAQLVVGGADERAFFSKAVSPTLLRAGANTLAVEIHQQNKDSSDVSFDLDLIGSISAQNVAPIVNAGPDLIVTLPQDATLNGSVIDDGLPTPPGAPANVWTVVSGPAPVTFGNAQAAKTTARFTSAGMYVLRLASTDGEFSLQDEITVEVRGDTGYADWKATNFSAPELLDPEISGDDADPDGDTSLNVEEYLAGTNPRNGQSYLGLGSVFTETGIGLQFQAMPGRTYNILTRESPDSGIWEQFRFIDSAPDPRVMSIGVEPALDEPSRFFILSIPTE